MVAFPNARIGLARPRGVEQRPARLRFPGRPRGDWPRRWPRGTFPAMAVDTPGSVADRIAVLVLRAQRRSDQDLADARAAWSELYEAHARQLASWLRLRVHASRVDDALQSIWLRVWEKLPTHFRGGHFRAWLFTIARNHLADLARMPPAAAAAADLDPDAGPADPAAVEPWQVLVDRECLEKLESGRRRVFVGRLGGEDYQTLADSLGITTAQAQSWLFVAKKLLRECLGEEAR